MSKSEMNPILVDKMGCVTDIAANIVACLEGSDDPFGPLFDALVRENGNQVLVRLGIYALSRVIISRNEDVVPRWAQVVDEIVEMLEKHPMTSQLVESNWLFSSASERPSAGVSLTAYTESDVRLAIRALSSLRRSVSKDIAALREALPSRPRKRSNKSSRNKNHRKEK